MRHSSTASWNFLFHFTKSAPRFASSSRLCMLLRKCLMISLTAPTIATEDWIFDSRARAVATWTMSSCISGCLRTFLWSRCFTNIDSKKCVFCPARSIQSRVLSSGWINATYWKKHTIFIWPESSIKYWTSLSTGRAIPSLTGHRFPLSK